MKRTWIILYGLAALLTLGPSSTAAENSKACTNQTPSGIKAFLATTSNAVIFTSETIGSRQIAYEMKDCEGKTVRVKVFDQKSETSTIFGPCESPIKVILQVPETAVTPYILTFEEFNPETGTWGKIGKITSSNYTNMTGRPDSR